MNVAVEDLPGREPFEAIRARLEPWCRAKIAEYPDSRSALLPILHAFQDEEGWVSPQAMAACAELLDLPVSTVESVASFYTLFFKRPIGKYMLQPCRGIACIINGAEKTMAYFREQLGLANLQTTDDGLISYEEVECLAACDRAPCMQVNLEFVYDLTSEKIDAMLAAIRGGSYDIAPLPQTAKPAKSWHVSVEPERRSAGAVGVENPNDPGGFGDASGLRLVERLNVDPHPVAVRPTLERLVVDGAALTAAGADAPAKTEH